MIDDAVSVPELLAASSASAFVTVSSHRAALLLGQVGGLAAESEVE